MNARAKILILALLQTGTMLAWAGYHERLWQTAPTFRIALAPVDPYDVLRGRYFILNPKGASIDPGVGAPGLAASLRAFLGKDDSYKGRAQIGFCSAGPIRTICALARPNAPVPAIPGALWAAGEVDLWPDQEEFNFWPDKEKVDLSPIQETKQVYGRIDLSLDRFFLPNRAQLPAPQTAPGWELEVVHRPGKLLLPKRLWFGGKPVEFGSR